PRVAATGEGAGGRRHSAGLDGADPAPPPAAARRRDRHRGRRAGGRRGVACPAPSGPGLLPGRGAPAPRADEQPAERPDQLRRRGQVPVKDGGPGRWRWPPVAALALAMTLAGTAAPGGAAGSLVPSGALNGASAIPGDPGNDPAA